MEDNMFQNQPQGNEVPIENQVAEWKRKAEEARFEADQARRDADMLRESQLRMMATQPQQPVIQEPVESEEELNNLFNNSPTQAVNRIVDRKAKDIDKMIETRARQIFIGEAKKIEAMNRFPELKNPNSEFFKKVAYYMDTHPHKYNDPEGILDACARVQIDIGSSSNAQSTRANETVRASVASAASQVAGGGTAPASDNPELDAKGLELASKLGIDPKVMAVRLKSYNEQTGQYAPIPGQTGKARLQ